MKNQADYVIAGGGMAGLSLALALSRSSLSFEQVLIFDLEEKKRNDRTWCFWTDKESDYDSILAHKWSQLSFIHHDYQATIGLGAYSYKMLRGEDFYAYVRSQLSLDKRFEFRYQVVDRISEDLTHAWIESGDQVYYAHYIFDSTFIAKDFKVDQSRYFFLKQHFYGLVIKTTKAVFDAQTPSFFDFRTGVTDAFNFMYLLPDSPYQSLVEFTFFSEGLLQKEQYLEGLKRYFREVLKIGDADYEIVEEEQGIIPMTDQAFDRYLGKRILAIGTKAGMVKACTGFAFWRTQSDCKSIVASLQEHGTPFLIKKPARRYATFDAMLLCILKYQPELGMKIFAVLFKKNPIDRIFRFLDETAGLGETLKLMASVPWWPFVAAWFRLKILRKH